MKGLSVIYLFFGKLTPKYAFFPFIFRVVVIYLLPNSYDSNIFIKCFYLFRYYYQVLSADNLQEVQILRKLDFVRLV